jgi:hypothetical protein
VFKEKARISLEEAKAIALKKYPGTIVETEFEIEADGSASYEFDIARKNGKEMKVEVDATSGKIVEANRELWQSARSKHRPAAWPAGNCTRNGLSIGHSRHVPPCATSTTPLLQHDSPPLTRPPMRRAVTTSRAPSPGCRRGSPTVASRSRN